MDVLQIQQFQEFADAAQTAEDANDFVGAAELWRRAERASCTFSDERGRTMLLGDSITTAALRLRRAGCLSLQAGLAETAHDARVALNGEFWSLASAAAAPLRRRFAAGTLLPRTCRHDEVAFWRRKLEADRSRAVPPGPPFHPDAPLLVGVETFLQATRFFLWRLASAFYGLDLPPLSDAERKDAQEFVLLALDVIAGSGTGSSSVGSSSVRVAVAGEARCVARSCRRAFVFSLLTRISPRCNLWAWSRSSWQARSRWIRRSAPLCLRSGPLLASWAPCASTAPLTATSSSRTWAPRRRRSSAGARRARCRPAARARRPPGPSASAPAARRLLTAARSTRRRTGRTGTSGSARSCGRGARRRRLARAAWRLTWRPARYCQRRDIRYQ